MKSLKSKSSQYVILTNNETPRESAFTVLWVNGNATDFPVQSLSEHFLTITKVVNVDLREIDKK